MAELKKAFTNRAQAKRIQSRLRRANFIARLDLIPSGGAELTVLVHNGTTPEKLDLTIEKWLWRERNL